MTTQRKRYRSRAWFETPELYGWLRQAALRSQGFDEAVSDARPIIGICNSWSELTHCNAHLRHLADAVKRGVAEAGGLPLEFPVMSLGEYNMRPTSMLYRNLMSMDVEESIRANPIDGVVLLAGCDKTTPAMLMGAASADVPAILVTGGPQVGASWRGERLGTCTDCRRYHQELRAGRITDADWADLQGSIIQSPGHCGVMGTASTMAAMGEALGIALPGNAAVPAADPQRARLAEEAGRNIVAAVDKDLKPSRLLTTKAFENAIRTLHAIGGSTNAIVHLTAIAGRVGLPLDLDLFDELSRSTPFILDLKPSGTKLMEDFFHAGGLPAVLGQISELLDLESPTVTGKRLGDGIDGAATSDESVIRSAEAPISAEGGLSVLRGTLAPDGAIVRQASASPELLAHRGRAIVFDSHDDLERRIDDPALDIAPDDVLVMRNSGPIGGPGMPEWGLLPLPRKLLEQGVHDMVRISDARMSGTAFGTVVVHVSPESAVGGPLAAVRDGDLIELDVPNRTLNLLVDEAVVSRRLAEAEATVPQFDRGYRWMYARHILQADQGCDFDFLRAEGVTQ